MENNKIQDENTIFEEKQENKLTFGKIILIILLIILILFGVLGTLCGGFFTVNFLLYGGGGYDFYIISVPSLIIGLLLFYFGYKLINNKSNLTKKQKFYIITLSIILGLTMFLYFFL